MSNYEALKALLIAQNEDCLLALESAAADLIVGMTAELSVLKDEIAWCKTQMAGLVDYEAEISNKLAAVSAERDRLQGENFTLRVEIKRLQGLVVEGGASVGDT